MRSVENIEPPPVSDITNRLSSLSIIVDDFDSLKATTSNKDTTVIQPVIKLYTRQSSDDSIKKILEEAENRKHEFWKLLEEHKAVIENLKRIERQKPTTVSQIPHSPPIRT